MKVYKEIFLDFDDTIYDTRGNSIIALGEIFRMYRLEHYFPDAQVFYDAYWQTNVTLWGQYARGEIPRDVLVLERFRQPLSVGMKEEATPEFCYRVSDDFLELCSNKPGVIDGARELLEYLTDKGYRIHMCSNGFSEVQGKKLDACGLAPYFHTMILSEAAGANKPSSAFFHYALEHTGADLSSTIMIGDNYNTDIEGAMGVGMDTILYKRWDADFQPPRPVTYMVKRLLEIKDIL